MPKEGKVVQVLGGVVDVQFPPDHLPNIYDALEIAREGQDDLVLEVQQHMGHDRVRCVAMDTTDGLSRGVTVVNTEARDQCAGRAGHPGPHLQRAGPPGR